MSEIAIFRQPTRKTAPLPGPDSLVFIQKPGPVRTDRENLLNSLIEIRTRRSRFTNSHSCRIPLRTEGVSRKALLLIVRGLPPTQP